MIWEHRELPSFSIGRLLWEHREKQQPPFFQYRQVKVIWGHREPPSFSIGMLLWSERIGNPLPLVMAGYSDPPFADRLLWSESESIKNKNLAFIDRLLWSESIKKEKKKSFLFIDRVLWTESAENPPPPPPPLLTTHSQHPCATLDSRVLQHFILGSVCRTDR